MIRNKCSAFKGDVVTACNFGWVVARSPQKESAMAKTKPHIEIPTTPPPATLDIEDIEVGEGAEAVPGMTVEVHYAGVSWSTGKEFDASWERRKTFSFRLGGGQVIQGWDQGVAGMRIGGRRRLVIPPGLAYGDREVGRGLIKANETLVFVVDLLSVAP